MTGIPLTSNPSGTIVPVLVVPGASRSEIIGPHGSTMRIRVAAPADKGRANREAKRLLSEFFGVKAVLVGGASSRRKRFLLEGLDEDTVRRQIAGAGQPLGEPPILS